jgi:hypothetical protein
MSPEETGTGGGTNRPAAPLRHRFPKVRPGRYPAGPDPAAEEPRRATPAASKHA